MAVLMTQQFSGEVPARMISAVGDEMNVREDPPEGLIVHTAVETPEGPRVIDVWESREAFERFQESRLMPAVQAVAQRNGVEGRPPQPEFQDIFDLVKGR